MIEPGIERGNPLQPLASQHDVAHRLLVVHVHPGDVGIGDLSLRLFGRADPDDVDAHGNDTLDQRAHQRGNHGLGHALSSSWHRAAFSFSGESRNPERLKRFFAPGLRLSPENGLHPFSTLSVCPEPFGCLASQPKGSGQTEVVPGEVKPRSATPSRAGRRPSPRHPLRPARHEWRPKRRNSSPRALPCAA